MTILRLLFTSFTCLVLGLSAPSALAEALTAGVCHDLVTEQVDVYQLFDQQKKPHRNYENIIAHDLRAGDVLRFSNGKEFSSS